MVSKKKTTGNDRANAATEKPAGEGEENEFCTVPEDGAAFFEEMVAQRILACVEALGSRFGRNKLAGILLGVSSNYIIEAAEDARPHYGTLARFSRPEITAMMDQLLGRGLVRIEGPERPHLFLTEEGKEALSDGCGARVRLPIRLDPKKVPVPTDANLYGVMRELRNNLAREEDLPAYCVFDNRTLLELVESRPADLEQLADVRGFSDRRCEKYGEAVVKTLAEYEAGRESPKEASVTDGPGDAPVSDDEAPLPSDGGADDGGDVTDMEAAGPDKDFRSAAELARANGLV